jgi:hypothetical protein
VRTKEFETDEDDEIERASCGFDVTVGRVVVNCGQLDQNAGTK